MWQGYHLDGDRDKGQKKVRRCQDFCFRNPQPHGKGKRLGYEGVVVELVVWSLTTEKKKLVYCGSCHYTCSRVGQGATLDSDWHTCTHRQHPTRPSHLNYPLASPAHVLAMFREGPQVSRKQSPTLTPSITWQPDTQEDPRVHVVDQSGNFWNRR